MFENYWFYAWAPPLKISGYAPVSDYCNIFVLLFAILINCDANQRLIYVRWLQT
jgi:hypothetical protein